MRTAGTLVPAFAHDLSRAHQYAAHSWIRGCREQSAGPSRAMYSRSLALRAIGLALLDDATEIVDVWNNEHRSQTV
jgi:hypothetical protein